jgi:hypothetical protein
MYFWNSGRPRMAVNMEVRSMELYIAFLSSEFLGCSGAPAHSQLSRPHRSSRRTPAASFSATSMEDAPAEAEPLCVYARLRPPAGAARGEVQVRRHFGQAKAIQVRRRPAASARP